MDKSLQNPTLPERGSLPDVEQSAAAIRQSMMQWAADGVDYDAREALTQIRAKLDVPDWQKEELDRRKALYQANPDAGRSWDEVQRCITKRHD